MIRLFAVLCALVFWLGAVAATPVQAQALLPDLGGSGSSEEDTQQEVPPAADPAETTSPDALPPERWLADRNTVDYAAWEDTALRVEQVLLRNQARPFALERLRAEVREWRDMFAQLMEQNADRIATVEAQIDALGPVPESGSEAETVANRREELVALRDLLASPALLAAEAHARAAGLISEIEGQLRDRQAADLLQRAPSPLLPAQWVAATEALALGLRDLGNEITTGISELEASTDGGRRTLLGLAAIALATALFVRGSKIANNLMPAPRDGVRRLFADFLTTVADAVLPLIGLVALSYGLRELDIFGPRGEAVVATLPVTGSVVILTIWLCRQFFPQGAKFGPLDLPEEVRLPARRTGLTLAWLTALWIPFDAFVQSGAQGETSIDTLTFPLIVAISLVLFRFARLLRNPPSEDAGPHISQGRTRSVIGRLAQIAALISPILAVFGYGAAAEGILFPSVLTLGVIGVVVYLQALTNRAHKLLAGDGDEKPYALLPVGVGFVLLLISIPVLALVWGAQRADLLDYWARFTEGFSFGETRISPTDFLWFVAVFTFGYFLTQLIKNTLRTSVLPRTRLDIGAQNATVSGFGYIGIFISAIVAITSAGIDLSNLAIVAGALSVGIGFGLQTIVSNFVSGIILLIERPVSEGDWIEVNGNMGIVRDISVRSTRIETFDQTDVIVPNADLVSNQVINWTRGNLIGRLILPIGVAYGSDVKTVMGILKEVAEDHPMVVMNPPPSVLFMNFGADALEFEIRAILRDVNFILAVRSEMNQEVSRRFTEAEIEVPFAQRDIWLRNPEALGQSAPQQEPKHTPATKKSDTVKGASGYNWDSDSADTDTDTNADGDVT